MPSNLFYSTQSNLATQGLAATLSSTFRRNVRVENGVYLGNNRILVGRQEYQFSNTGGQTIKAGASIAVQNIGRKAAAIYAPTDLPAGLAVSGGSSATTTTSNLTVHTHAGTDSGGSTLTAVTTNWKFLLLSVTATLQAALDRLDSYGMFVKTTVQSGATLTIPNGYQMIVYGPYTIAGNLVVIGDLYIS
ncbi:MAG: hypothetical protein DDT21_01834 [Syntrophomonadaceae bacterium]|nr:hypothetical protein [Bacillota bacterium]